MYFKFISRSCLLNKFYFWELLWDLCSLSSAEMIEVHQRALRAHDDTPSTLIRIKYSDLSSYTCSFHHRVDSSSAAAVVLNVAQPEATLIIIQ